MKIDLDKIQITTTATFITAIIISTVALLTMNMFLIEMSVAIWLLFVIMFTIQIDREETVAKSSWVKNEFTQLSHPLIKGRVYVDDTDHIRKMYKESLDFNVLLHSNHASKRFILYKDWNQFCTIYNPNENDNLNIDVLIDNTVNKSTRPRTRQIYWQKYLNPRFKIWKRFLS